MPFSKGVRAGDLVFFSGAIPVGPKGKLVGGDIAQQTRQIMENLKANLELAGCTLADVVKCTAWLTDTSDFLVFNQVYAEYFKTDPPARSTVRADLMIDVKVEMEAIAYKPLNKE